MATVAEALSSSGLDPTALTLEITEGALAGDLDAVTILQRLRDLGVSIAIDDFGTGHSSLARLRDLPVDHVKIDRSFVGEIDDRGSAPIASATIALAHSLGLSVVAEGVETPRQVHFLRQHGCDAIQGYLASPPADPDRIGQLLADAQPLLFAGGATPDPRDDQGRRAEAGPAAARPLRSPHRQPAPSRPEVPVEVDGVLAGATPSAS